MSALTERVAAFWERVQTSLFPALEEAGVEMTAKLYQLVTILEVLQIERFVAAPSPYVRGVKPKDRRCLARACVAMAFYGGTDRQAFRDRLRADAALRKVCGWTSRGQVPSLATFSRAFRDFARPGWPTRCMPCWCRAGGGRTWCGTPPPTPRPFRPAKRR